MHFTIVVSQIQCCLDKEKPSDVLREEVMGVQIPRWIFNFLIVYAQKILFKLCSCIYEIQTFCTGKHKNCTLFSHFASVYWLCPWTNLGISALQTPWLHPFIQFLIYLLWYPSTVKSWVRLWCNPSQSPSPQGSWLWLPRHTGVMWGHSMLDIARHVICTK